MKHLSQFVGEFDGEDLEYFRNRGRKLGRKRNKSKSEGGRVLPQADKRNKRENHVTLECGTRVHFNTADTREGRGQPGRMEVGEFTGLTRTNGYLVIDTDNGDEFSVHPQKYQIE